MHANSRAIVTNQPGPHQELARRVSRALVHPLKKPIAEHTRSAFAKADAWRSARPRPLILDAGCGVGLSTRQLAEQFPDHVVIGVDRSADRLSRDHGELPDNALLVRADLVDFWRLALAAGWQPARHYVLYPNPYPKAAHLKMRWHGHPVFPAILALGGRFELRSNWRLYVEEFALAIQQATGEVVHAELYRPDGEFLTPFERKYHGSGQSLWRLQLDLPPAPELLPTP
ncbi:tRNA G46 methylase TrmB [Onishia taeanensis]|uniref:tRNA (guanine(46)-N(7))-methyltransferase n=1 Tax=Onishia taeanensis TaxID=284577 RepID=A0A1G7SSL0_9GAMM|nr:methyltransferase domain-containing protein [Halomonas taeanensis]SDG25928.1 tRNA G46 methylase TrmB [Halomonas taeanensis]